MSGNVILTDTMRAMLFVRSEDGNYRGWRVSLLTNEIDKFEARFLICALCQGLLREACLFEDKSEQEFRCSVCLPENAPVTKIEINQESVNEKLVVCPLREKGCEWSGAISHVISHLNECDVFPVECPLGCVSGKEEGNTTVRIERRFLEEHQSSLCPMRSFNCEYCDSPTKVSEMNEHISSCEEYLVPCPNSCSGEEDTRKLRRKDLPSHLGEYCPLQEVECPYAEYGCSEKMERRLVGQHEKESIHKHFGKAIVKIKEQSNQIECLKEEVLKRDRNMLEMGTNQFNELSLIKYHNIVEMAKLKSEMDFLITSTNYSPRGVLEWEIPGVTNHLTTAGVSYSHQFNVGLYRYQAKIEWGSEIHGYVGCLLFILKGDYDDKLSWPCVGLKYTFILTNQNDNTQNYFRKYEVNKESISKDAESFQKPTEFGNTPFGMREFVSHHSIKKAKYLKNDSILLKIIVD